MLGWSGVRDVLLQHCMFGGPRDKKTRLRTNARALEALGRLCDGCHAPWAPGFLHRPWGAQRRDSGLEFATDGEAAYPWGLARELADAFATELRMPPAARAALPSVQAPGHPGREPSQPKQGPVGAPGPAGTPAKEGLGGARGRTESRAAADAGGSTLTPRPEGSARPWGEDSGGKRPRSEPGALREARLGEDSSSEEEPERQRDQLARATGVQARRPTWRAVPEYRARVRAELPAAEARKLDRLAEPPCLAGVDFPAGSRVAARIGQVRDGGGRDRSCGASHGSAVESG